MPTTTTNLNIRLTDAAKRAMQRAADAANRKLSDWARLTLLAAAKKKTKPQ